MNRCLFATLPVGLSTHLVVLLSLQAPSSAVTRSSFRLLGQPDSGLGLSPGAASPDLSPEPRRWTGKRLTRLNSSVAQRVPSPLELSSSPETGRVEPVGLSRRRRRSPPASRSAAHGEAVGPPLLKRSRPPEGAQEPPPACSLSRPRRWEPDLPPEPPPFIK